MNLESTISIYAGGSGSGCKGPNCGRPAKKWGTTNPAMALKSANKKNMHAAAKTLMEHNFTRKAGGTGGYASYAKMHGQQVMGSPSTWTRLGKEESPNLPGELKSLGQRFRSHEVFISPSGWHHTSQFGGDYVEHGKGLSAESLHKHLVKMGL